MRFSSTRSSPSSSSYASLSSASTRVEGGPAWAVSTEWLSAGTAAAGLAQINAISNLAGFGTTYVMGLIKDATGTFTLALVPLVALAAAAAVAILWIGRVETRIELGGGNQATVGP